MSKPRTLALVQARDRAHRRDAAGCLAALLSAWGYGPALELVEPIRRVGEFAQQCVLPPFGDTVEAHEMAWHRAAAGGDAVVRGVLIAMVLPAEPAHLLARIERLTTYRDPRVSAWICRVTAKRAYDATADNRDAWARVFEWLGRTIDPVVAPAFPTIDDRWEALLDIRPEVRLQGALRKLRKPMRDAAYEVARLPPDEATWCGEITAAFSLPPPDPVEEAMLAEIYATPEADAPRSVYADWLLERGEPRGELISLQLARAAGQAPQLAREADLIAVHGGSWLGPLAGKLSAPVFERGFVVEGTATAPLDDHPAWSTLSTLRGQLPPTDRPMPQLRRLLDLQDHQVIQLAYRTTPLPVEYLSWQGPIDLEIAGLRDAWARITTLPALRELVLASGRSRDGYGSPDPTRAAWLWSAPVARELEALEMLIGMTGLRAWLDALERTRIARVTLRDRWTARLTRGAGGRLDQLTLTVPWAFDPEFDEVALAQLITCQGRFATVHVIVPPVPATAEYYETLHARLTTAVGTPVPTFEHQ